MIWFGSMLHGHYPEWLPKGDEAIRDYFRTTWVVLTIFMLSVSLYALAFITVSKRIATAVVVSGFVAALLNMLLRDAFRVDSLPVQLSDIELSSILNFLIGAGLLHVLLGLGVWIGSARHRCASQMDA